MLKKTTFATVVASGLTIAAANDLYIVNHETLYLAAFVALLRALYIKVGPLVDEFCTQGVNVRIAYYAFFFRPHFMFFGIVGHEGNVA